MIKMNHRTARSRNMGGRGQGRKKRIVSTAAIEVDYASVMRSQNLIIARKKDQISTKSEEKKGWVRNFQLAEYVGGTSAGICDGPASCTAG